MKRNDRFIYREGDIEVKRIYCEFCKHYLKENESICREYPQGKPKEIIDVKQICSKFRK